MCQNLDNKEHKKYCSRRIKKKERNSPLDVTIPINFLNASHTLELDNILQHELVHWLNNPFLLLHNTFLLA